MIVNRRTMLGAVAAGGVALPLGAVRAGTPPEKPLRVILFDSRYEQSAAFAHALSRPRVLAVDTRSRDIGLAWHGEISDHLGRHPGRVEGLSLYSDQYISAELARPLGLRHSMVNRIEGRPTLFRWRLA